MQFSSLLSLEPPISIKSNFQIYWLQINANQYNIQPGPLQLNSRDAACIW